MKITAGELEVLEQVGAFQREFRPIFEAEIGDMRRAMVTTLGALAQIALAADEADSNPDVPKRRAEYSTQIQQAADAAQRHVRDFLELARLYTRDMEMMRACAAQIQTMADEAERDLADG